MGGRRTPPFLSYGDLREERRLLGMDRIAPPLLGAPVLSPTCRSLSASCRSGMSGELAWCSACERSARATSKKQRA
jgi:hypothetical protein